LRSAVNDVRAAGTCQRFVSDTCICGVVGTGARWDRE
jgi:hypothetical protein